MTGAAGLVNFVNNSPSPYHAVAECISMLQNAGFSELHEGDEWNVENGRKYYCTRNKSTIIAFAIGNKYEAGNGFIIVGAHTDSPCPKVKPMSKREKEGYLQIGISMYGGGIWHTWFDRDLSVAGRCIVKEGDALVHRLVRIDKPIMNIPNICIHLQRNHNESFGPNKETNIVPILGFKPKSSKNADGTSCEVGSPFQSGKHNDVFLKMLSDQLGVDVEDIVDMELCLMDTQPAVIGGINDELVFAPRLDNLFNCYTSLHALIETCDSLSSESRIRMVSLFDNEEVGSQSAQGAASALQQHVCARLSDGKFEQAMPKSYILSADQAHAVHPNYVEKHEDKHRPSLDGGIVLKMNANQRYATTAITGAVVREVAFRVGVPIQDFVVRNDSPCGSTIGPMMSANLACPTADIGGPQLAMHSCRETCSTVSVDQAIKLYTGFFHNFSDIYQNMR